MPPRIAIPTPTSSDPAYNTRSWPAYAEAVTRAGGTPIEIPLNAPPNEIANLINTCQAICLPGSPADVNPHKYGQDPIPACAPPDHARENVDELLIQDAHNLYKPILAICYGAQILNVWRGGTLLQDLTPLPVNHEAGRAVAIAHTAAIAPNSLLGDLLPPAEAPLATPGSDTPPTFLRLPINSSHHQAIAIPGDGLRVSARCPQDGVIEAVEGGQAHDDGQRHFVLAVQWHPERNLGESPASQAIFKHFIAEAQAWTPRQITTSVA